MNNQRGRRAEDSSGYTVSRTSQAVAVTRAEFARPHSPGGDPDAQTRLCAGMRSAPVEHMRASLAARTRFFDGQVLAALSAGVRQIAILGAGFDDRALRFRTPDVTFFELDHPGTQAEKAARLAVIQAEDGADHAAPVLAAADFRTDDVAAVLARSGHDPDLPTLFICEGLLVYFDQPSTVRFLRRVRTAAAPGSSLAASLAIHAEGLPSARVLEVANGRRRTADAEPWLTILPASEQAELLASAGWRITSALDAADLGTGADRGRSLLVTAEPAG